MRLARLSWPSGDFWVCPRVDMETHPGALEADGSTIIVLAEGITHIRRNQAFAGLHFDETNVLAISQFPPSQSWAGAPR
jgi:predicted Rossmann fold nucleotide-binding protein DprA/Smf involved in DNA uptake